MLYRPHTTALDQLAALVACGEPTELLPAIRIAKTLHNTEPMFLPKDIPEKPGVFCLTSLEKWDTKSDLWIDTLYRIEGLCERYHKVMGCYPDEICLSAERYYAKPEKPYEIKSFYPRDIHAKPIPFVWERGSVGKYEVLVRGKI